MLRKIVFLLYGVISYALFIASILYTIGFVGNLIVTKSIDSTVGATSISSLFTDIMLISLFAFQHSVMARPAFKQWWTRIVPQPIERSTYVLFASLLLFLIFWQWRPMTDPIWLVSNSIGSVLLQGVFWIGWLIVVLSSFMINHFDLFGLQQVYLNLRARPHPPSKFKIAFFYHFVRHPLLLGFIIAFWATPSMTVGHLLFAVVTTVYMLIGIQFEEHDMNAAFGETFQQYKRRVSMLIPLPKRSDTQSSVSHPSEHGT